MGRDIGYEVDGASRVASRVSCLRTWIRAVVVLMVVGAALFTVWYRHVYNVLPGQSASGRVHWCGRDYQVEGPPVTRQQALADAGWPLHAEGTYPPLSLSREVLLAATYPAGLKTSTSCATLLFLRTGPDVYKPYDLEGGP
jgi:hypothetical protein